MERDIADDKSDLLGLSSGAFGVVAGYSTLAGLCPLIPIPFLDDAIIEQVRRRMYAKVCAEREFALAPADVRFLTARVSNVLGSVFKSLVLWPIKKLLRKVIYVFAVKSCADVAAAVFHEGWLFARAVEQEYVERDALAAGDHDALRDLRRAIMLAHDEVSPDVTKQAMRAAFGVGRGALASTLVALKRIFQRGKDDDQLDEAEHEVAPIRDRIEAELRAHWPLADELDAALTRSLASVAPRALPA